MAVQFCALHIKRGGEGAGGGKNVADLGFWHSFPQALTPLVKITGGKGKGSVITMEQSATSRAVALLPFFP